MNITTPLAIKKKYFDLIEQDKLNGKIREANKLLDILYQILGHFVTKGNKKQKEEALIALQNLPSNV